MPVQLIKKTNSPLLSPALLRKIYYSVCKQARYPKKLNVTIITVRAAEMKKLNAIYRQKTTVTDVLSFLYEPNLGEIVICYPQAVKQALEKKTNLSTELIWLVTHGMLHLLGYDHITKAMNNKMRQLEQKIIRYVQV